MWAWACDWPGRLSWGLVALTWWTPGGPEAPVFPPNGGRAALEVESGCWAALWMAGGAALAAEVGVVAVMLASLARLDFAPAVTGTRSFSCSMAARCRLLEEPARLTVLAEDAAGTCRAGARLGAEL